MNKIIVSVGRNGKNHSADVVLIQKFLNVQKPQEKSYHLKWTASLVTKQYPESSTFRKTL